MTEASGKGAGSGGRLPVQMLSIPAEILTMLGFAGAVFAVVVSGSAISSWINSSSPWLFAAAYGVPAALAFALYWLIARRL